MARVNTGRVIIGGLLAGLIINISETILNVAVLGDINNEILRARNLPPISGSEIGWFVGLAFLLGIGTVWVYAAIRTRYGAGPATSIVTGVAVWFFAYFYPTIGLVVLGFFPAGIAALALLWGLGEMVLASVAGAWLYTE
jgi:hypothetical protein